MHVRKTRFYNCFGFKKNTFPRKGDWDFNACSVDLVFCGILMVLQRIIACTENQKKGVVFLLDFKDFTLAHVRQFTPALVKKLADLIQVSS